MSVCWKIILVWMQFALRSDPLGWRFSWLDFLVLLSLPRLRVNVVQSDALGLGPSKEFPAGMASNGIGVVRRFCGKCLSDIQRCWLLTLLM